jgi:Uma2 family endonuclease
LIIEVLSNTTRNYDKGDKFGCYRKIKSLKKYIMIESDTTEKEPTVYIRTLEDDKNFTEKVVGIDEILDILGTVMECDILLVK